MSVIVVGAGPAGATAARALAQAGVTVRLLDRSKFPRNKPCGGGISLRVLQRFPYLGPALSRIGTHTVSRLYLEGPDGASTVIDAGEPAALMIRRVEFDALLVSLAQEAGAELFDGADIVQAADEGEQLVLTARDGRRFAAPVVIAADGVHSVVARRLGLNDGWPREAIALDVMEETPRATLSDVDPSTLWVAYGYDVEHRNNGSRRAPEGYAYVFPKRDHVNVGIGYVLDHYRRSIPLAPYAMQQRFVGDLRSRGVLSGESERANFTPFLIPVGGPLRVPGSGRVLLAGDAGGFVNGFTAEGIYYAMVTGELAAKAIVAGSDGCQTGVRWVSDTIQRYRRLCDAEIGAELRDSVLLRQYLFANRRRIARVIEGASEQRDMTRSVIDFAIGRMSYKALRRRMLSRVPAMAGQVAWQWMRMMVDRCR